MAQWVYHINYRVGFLGPGGRLTFRNMRVHRVVMVAFKANEQAPAPIR